MTKKIIHIPLTHQGISKAFFDNFLEQNHNIFIMDNHRLALWAWFQIISQNQRYNLLHIDAHPDLNPSALKSFEHNLFEMNLEAYRSAFDKTTHQPLFRWDNYLPIFIEKYPQLTAELFSCTHDVGSSLSLKNRLHPYSLVQWMSDIFYEKIYLNDLPWIINIDCDFFINSRPLKIQMYSDEYIETIGKVVKHGLKNKAIAVVTIAMSPECCGSWENAQKILDKLNINNN